MRQTYTRACLARVQCQSQGVVSLLGMLPNITLNFHECLMSMPPPKQTQSGALRADCLAIGEYPPVHPDHHHPKETICQLILKNFMTVLTPGKDLYIPPIPWDLRIRILYPFLNLLPTLPLPLPLSSPKSLS